MKLQIDKLFRSTKRKDGTPLVNKQGKPYTLISITSGGKKYTYFDSYGDSANWLEGMETPDMEVEESGEYNGEKQYLLRKPNKTAQLEDRVKALEERMNKCAKVIADMSSKPQPW